MIEDKFDSCMFGDIEYEPFYIAEEGYYDEESYRVCKLGYCPYECESCGHYCKNEDNL